MTKLKIKLTLPTLAWVGMTHQRSKKLCEMLEILAFTGLLPSTLVFKTHSVYHWGMILPEIPVHFLFPYVIPPKCSFLVIV